MDLHVTITNKRATYNEADGEIICGNSNYNIIFSFDSEWSAAASKIARFVWKKDGVYKFVDVEFKGDICPVPVLANVEYVKIGVYAGELTTSTPAIIKCKKSILCGGGVNIHEGTLKLEAITVTENNKTITPSAGFYGLEKVNVEIYQPKLFTPTLEKTDGVNEFILNDAKNGAFKRTLTLYLDGEVIRVATIEGILAETINLTDILPVFPLGDSHYLKARCVGAGFYDSDITEDIFWQPVSNANSISFVMGDDGWICLGWANDTTRYANIPSEISGVPVVELADRAFRSTKTTGANIPSTIKRMGTRVFQSNRDTLTSAVINYGLKRIEMMMFDRAKLLTSITIPESVEYIGERAFQECKTLTTVTIPNSVKIIDTAAFELCSGLETVYLGCGLEKIDDAFKDNESIKYIYCAFDEGDVAGAPWGAVNATVYYGWTDGGSAGLTYQKTTETSTTYNLYSGNNASGDVRIAYTYKNEPVTYIWANAFDNNAKITSVTIPAAVTGTGAYVFRNCTNLKKVTLLSTGYLSFGPSAFAGCVNLAEVHIKSLIALLNSTFSGFYSNPLWNGAGLYLNGEEVASLTIPEEITAISKYAFAGCSSISSVTIHKGVTEVDANAFYKCTNLKEIFVPWAEGDVSGAPWGATNAVIHYAGGTYAVGLEYILKYGTYSVKGNGTNTETNIVIPASVDGKNVTRIESHAFTDSEITSIVIPETVMNLEPSSLSCDTLKTVRFKGTIEDVENLGLHLGGGSWVYCFQNWSGDYNESPINNKSITDIFVPWAEGDVSGAPWGAVNATIHYNSEV